MTGVERTVERHPMTGALYRALDEHRVEVELNGTSGVFSRDGVWIEGELRSADAQLCRWVVSEVLTHQVKVARSQA